MTGYTIPFAQRALTFTLPAGMRGIVAASRQSPPLEAEGRSVRRSPSQLATNSPDRARGSASPAKCCCVSCAVVPFSQLIGFS
jgi:hypothetical protein